MASSEDEILKKTPPAWAIPIIAQIKAARAEAAARTLKPKANDTTSKRKPAQEGN